jgi:hypothetical protein
LFIKKPKTKTFQEEISGREVLGKSRGQRAARIQ